MRARSRKLLGAFALVILVAVVAVLIVPKKDRTLAVIVGAVAAALLGVPAFLISVRDLMGGDDKTERPPLSLPPRVPEPRPRETGTPNRVHQLPRPPDDFVGREAELAELLDGVRSGGVTISGLQGMGGVGKTALALVLAQKLKDDCRDAQIFLDLKGASPSPLSPAEAMRHVVLSFHPEARPPDDERQLRALYCSVLDGKRALLLLDNAAGREQVEPLVPPTSCVLIVTSRRHFVLPGLVTTDLTALPQEEARTLLIGIARRAEPQADEIARLCGYLPLALRAAASALAERPDLALDDLLARLRDATQRPKLTGAGPALMASYELLSPDEQAAWRTLAVFPGDFDPAAAAAVWAVERDVATDRLSDLTRYSLLQWDDAARRYRLHDLARDVAASLTTDDEREAAERRHAEHYASELRRAKELYKKGGEEVLRGLALLDLERENIEAGQAWAAARADADRRAAELTSDYPGAGVYVLSLRLHAREQARWLEAALAAARTLGDRAAEGYHLGNLGLAYADLGQTQKAIECYEQRIEIAREIGDRRGEGTALNNLGLAYAALGQTQKAIECYEQALVITREIGDRRGEAQDLGNLGNAYRRLGQTQKAIEYHQQDLAIAREIGDRRGEGNALGNLGIAYAALGQTQKAIECYEQHLTIAREIGDRRGETIASWNLGLVYEDAGDLERAVALMQVRVDYEREIGHADAEKRAARVEALRKRMQKPPKK